MTPLELHDEMLHRCHQVWRFHRRGVNPDAVANAIGALLETEGGGVMAVEVALTPDGLGTVTVRSFDASGEARDLHVLEMDRSVMITD